MSKTGMVILNYNSSDLILDKLSILNSYDCIDKIIIIDNFSKDNSYEKLKKFENKKIEVIRAQKNGGYAYGNNVGLKRLFDEGYNYSFVMNPDVIISNVDLEKIINKMNENGEYAILGAIRTSKNNIYDQSQFWNIPEFKEELYSYIYLTRKIMSKKEAKYLKSEDRILDVGVVPGCLFLLNLKIGAEVDFFDENTFLYYEENILAKKIRKKGYKSGICLNSIYVHDHDLSASKNNSNKIIKKYLYESKKYYNENYLDVNKFGIFVLNILNYINRIERGFL